MKIGIKYCGGCNPRYERTSIARQLKKDLPNCEIVAADTAHETDFVVIVCGCKSACALADGLYGRYGRAFLTQSDAYDGLLDNLKNIQQTKEI
ncbi:MAG: hypothetical protein RR234_05565 [Christensenella sp.]